VNPGYRPTNNPITGKLISNVRPESVVSQELIDAVDPYIDFTDVKLVFFVYPNNAVEIYDGLGFAAGVKTSEGPIFAEITASSATMFLKNYPIWSWWLHENLHFHGLTGHAPNDSVGLNIMTNQWGSSLPLGTWDQMTMGWNDPLGTYCVDYDSLSKSTVTMSPLERSEKGMKSILIKLSDHEVLVVESRRRDKWSSGFNGYPGLPKGFYGLIVYKVDTAMNGNRVDEPTGARDWRDQSSAFAYYIRNPKVDHGSGMDLAYSPPFDRNFLIYEGETLSYRGVNIKLVQSGDNDKVEISKSF
jgi:hypothetical protein